MKKIKANVVKRKQVKKDAKGTHFLKKYFEMECLVVSNTESLLCPQKDRCSAS